MKKRKSPLGDKSSSFAKHHMRENRNNQYRIEQQVVCSELREQFPEYSILMEVSTFYVDEQGKTRLAIADIIIVELGVYYRLNGAIHNSNRAEEHDWEQKLYLEASGYLVIDVES